jgi:hypothetical protein
MRIGKGLAQGLSIPGLPGIALPTVPGAVNAAGGAVVVSAFGGPDVVTQAATEARGQVASAQQAIQGASADAQAQWNQAVSQEANDARVINGAAAAGSLLQNGFNPNDPADEQKAYQAIVAGVSLIPGIGLVLGGALEILDAIGVAAASALEALGLISKPGCTYTGTPTINDVLSEYPVPAANTPQGSFASLAMAALGQNVLQQRICSPKRYPNDWILAGVASLWNQYAQGAPQTLWVPPLDVTDSLSVFDPMNPYITDQVPYAFQPIQNVPSYIQNPSTLFANRYVGAAVTVNAGPFVPPAPSASTGGGTGASTATSPAKTAALATAGIAGAGVVGVGLYAYFTKMTFLGALRKLLPFLK